MSEMTATRMGHPLRLATLAVLAGVWAAAAFFLWDVDQGAGRAATWAASRRARLLRRGFLHRAEHYESFFYWLVLGADDRDARRLRRSTPGAERAFARESAAGPIGTAMLLAMLGFGARLARLGSRSRCSRSGGSAATTSRTRATATVIFGGWLAARGRVPPPLRAPCWS